MQELRRLRCVQNLHYFRMYRGIFLRAGSKFCVCRAVFLYVQSHMAVWKISKITSSVVCIITHLVFVQMQNVKYQQSVCDHAEGAQASPREQGKLVIIAGLETWLVQSQSSQGNQKRLWSFQIENLNLPWWCRWFWCPIPRMGHTVMKMGHWSCENQSGWRDYHENGNDTGIDLFVCKSSCFK